MALIWYNDQIPQKMKWLCQSNTGFLTQKISNLLSFLEKWYTVNGYKFC